MKSPVVVDTNVLSFLFGGLPEARLYERDLVGRRIVVPAQVAGEILFGARSLPRATEESLAAWLAALGSAPCGEDVVDAWASIMHDLTSRSPPAPLSVQDTWVAATAIGLDVPLVAHDAAFRRVRRLRLVCHAPA